MNCSEIDYGGIKLISAKIPPSRYLFMPKMLAKMLSWQIAMADNTARDILFSEINSNDDITKIGSKIFFNLKSSSLLGANPGVNGLNFEDLIFEKLEKDSHEISFSPENSDNLSCIPKVNYRLSELYFRLELSIANNGSFPIYWRPAVHFFIHLPWTEGTPLEKHIVKCLAKKRLRISDSLCVVNSVKCAERTSLEVLNDGILGFSQLQDSKIWIGTSNEEEGISFIFGNKTQKSIMMIRKTETLGKVELAFISDLPAENETDIINSNIQNYCTIPSGKTETFAVEISAY